MAFQDTANKQLVRRSWDLPIIRERQEALGRPLAYFGMCGPEMHDIRDWASLIGPKCCIEARGNTKEEQADLSMRLSRMRTTAQTYNVASEFQQLVGKVEDVILEGLDSKNTRPTLTEVSKSAKETLFRYDLYNLDFDGGMGFPDSDGEVARLNAFGKLFDRQKGHDFTLFLTVNVRDKIGVEVDKLLKELGVRKYGGDWDALVEWHRTLGKDEYAVLLKAAVPLFMHRQAEPRGFRPKCYPPVVYTGHGKARMVHFAFDFTYVAGTLVAVGEQEERELLALPLVESVGTQFGVASKGSPSFDETHCRGTLTPLDQAARELALAWKQPKPKKKPLP